MVKGVGGVQDLHATGILTRDGSRSVDKMYKILKVRTGAEML